MRLLWKSEMFWASTGGLQGLLVQQRSRKQSQHVPWPAKELEVIWENSYTDSSSEWSGCTAQKMPPKEWAAWETSGLMSRETQQERLFEPVGNDLQPPRSVGFSEIHIYSTAITWRVEDKDLLIATHVTFILMQIASLHPRSDQVFNGFPMALVSYWHFNFRIISEMIQSCLAKSLSWAPVLSNSATWAVPSNEMLLDGVCSGAVQAKAVSVEGSHRTAHPYHNSLWHLKSYMSSASGRLALTVMVLRDVTFFPLILHVWNPHNVSHQRHCPWRCSRSV